MSNDGSHVPSYYNDNYYEHGYYYGMEELKDMVMGDEKAKTNP